MAERSKALDWKFSNIFTGVRGFESHPLRHINPISARSVSSDAVDARRPDSVVTVRMLRIVPVALILVACAPAEPVELRGSAMGTTWTVTLEGALDDTDIARAENVIDEVLADVDATLSTWNPGSEISSLNRRTRTDWIASSDALYTVLAAAKAVNRESSGAFDVTVAPSVALWGFGADARSGSPSEQDLAQARSLTGPDAFELRAGPNAVRKAASGVRFDVDAIAPGYAVDRISDELSALGFEDHIVEIGGEVRCRGRGPGGRAWRVAVERPRAGVRTIQAVVALDGLGISTSGDYRDFRVSEGRRIAHAIDPRTGRPVTHPLASVSVVHESVMLADAYATALMVLGPEQGYALAERLELPVLLVTRTTGGFAVRVTPSFARLQVGDAGLPHGAHN